MTVSLYETIVNIQNGGKEKILTIIEMFTPLIKKYARKLKYEDAENDLIISCIEIVMKIPINNKNMHDDIAIKAYIITSLRYKYFKLSKSYCKVQNSELINIEIVPDNLVYDNESSIIFNCYLENLTEKQKLVLRKILVNCYSETEISGQLGISRQAVNRLKASALEKKGCQDTCQNSCQCAIQNNQGCQSACENTCQCAGQNNQGCTESCESSCQTSCELNCMSVFEHQCPELCQAACEGTEGGGGNPCASNCQCSGQNNQGGIPTVDLKIDYAVVNTTETKVVGEKIPIRIVYGNIGTKTSEAFPITIKRDASIVASTMISALPAGQSGDIIFYVELYKLGENVFLCEADSDNLAQESSDQRLNNYFTVTYVCSENSDVITAKIRLEAIFQRHPGYEMSLKNGSGYYDSGTDGTFNLAVTQFFFLYKELHPGNYLQGTYNALPIGYRLTALFRWIEMVYENDSVIIFPADLLPEDYYENIPELPLYDDLIGLITKENKYDSTTAFQYYVLHYYPIDAFNELHYDSPDEDMNGKRNGYNQWARFTYGSSAFEDGLGFAIGALSGLAVAPLKVAVDTIGGIIGIFKEWRMLIIALDFISRAKFSPANQAALVMMIDQAVSEWKQAYDDADPLQKGYKIGSLVGEAIFTVADGIGSVKALRTFIKSGGFTSSFRKISHVIYKVRHAEDDLLSYIKRFTKSEDVYKFWTHDGAYFEVEARDIPSSNIDELNVMLRTFAKKEIRNALSDFNNALTSKEISLVLADGREFEPRKLAIVLDASDPNNIMKKTYGFNQVWDANPSIGDDIIDATGITQKELKSLYVKHNLETIYDNSFIDELFAAYPEHFEELGVTKNEVIEEMEKLRELLRNTKAQAAAVPDPITAPDGTPSFVSEWSVENCAEVWAVRNAILSGVKMDNILLRTITYKEGKIAELCENCQKTFHTLIEAGRVIND